MTAVVAPTSGAANGTGMLTRAQAEQITRLVEVNRSSNGDQGYPQLMKALGVHSQAQAQGIAAEALRMTGHTDSQIKSLLQLPHGASLRELISQALVGLGLAGGAAIVGAGSGAAADAAAADTAASGGAAVGAAGGGAAGAASKIASGVANNAGKIAAGAAGLTLAGMFTDVSWWKGAGMILAGVILIVLALRMLA